MNPRKYIIGSRGSDLALWQANFFKKNLLDTAQADSEIKIITTKGDSIQHLSFDKIEGKGFFTKELEDALLAGEIDIAVHSMKDMPTSHPDGLVLGGLSYREDPRDVLIIRNESLMPENLFKLATNATIGTSSIRRKSQLLFFNDQYNVIDLRGNVPTRIQKLRDAKYDAIMLAKAGITRLNLNLDGLTVIDLHPAEFVPAPAQGVLAYQCRQEDVETRLVLKTMHNEKVADCTNVERKVLKMMEGGCQVPLGVHCERDANGFYHAHAAYSPAQDAPLIKVKQSSSTTFELAENLVTAIKTQLKS
jgi:hydroxymethylbilane synthase